MWNFSRHIVNYYILNSDESDFDGFSDVGSGIEMPDVSDSFDSYLVYIAVGNRLMDIYVFPPHSIIPILIP